MFTRRTMSADLVCVKLFVDIPCLSQIEEVELLVSDRNGHHGKTDGYFGDIFSVTILNPVWLGANLCGAESNHQPVAAVRLSPNALRRSLLGNIE